MIKPSEIIEERIEFWKERRASCLCNKEVSLSEENSLLRYECIFEELTAILPGIKLAESGMSKSVMEEIAHGGKDTV